MALAGNSRQCVVHPAFKCVVIVSRQELPKLPIALLNRFEKHFLDRSVALHSILHGNLEQTRQITKLRAEIEEWIHQFCTPYKKYQDHLSSKAPEDVFLGYSPSLIDSLILSYLSIETTNQRNPEYFEQLKAYCQERLLLVAKPEAVAQLQFTKLDGYGLEERYFTKQVRLPSIILSSLHPQLTCNPLSRPICTYLN